MEPSIDHITGWPVQQGFHWQAGHVLLSGIIPSIASSFSLTEQQEQ